MLHGGATVREPAPKADLFLLVIREKQSKAKHDYDTVRYSQLQNNRILYASSTSVGPLLKFV